MIRVMIPVTAMFLTCSCSWASSADVKGSISTFALPSGIQVKIVEAPFSRAVFKVEPCKNGEISICRINGKLPHGVDGSEPKTYLKELTVSYKGKSYKLETSGMFNAWGARPLQHPGSVRYFGGFCYDENTCVVRGLFADGAASYVAEWAIVDGVPERRIITESSDVVHLFIKNIDPPRFE